MNRLPTSCLVQLFQIEISNIINRKSGPERVKNVVCDLLFDYSTCRVLEIKSEEGKEKAEIETVKTISLDPQPEVKSVV